MPFQMEVIDDETHNHELCIFTRCAIECEGITGTTESPEGSINFASWFATGENYVICKVKRGVKYLGDILSEGQKSCAVVQKQGHLFAMSLRISTKIAIKRGQKHGVFFPTST